MESDLARAARELAEAGLPAPEWVVPYVRDGRERPLLWSDADLERLARRLAEFGGDGG